MKVVLLFSQLYPNFRIAELQGICDGLNINFDVSQIDTKGPLFLVDVQSEDDVRKLLSRSLLLKSAYFYMFMSNSYEGLSNEITSHEEVFENFDHPSKSFSVVVRPVGRRKGVNCVKMASEFASILPLDAAPVDLNNPDNTFTVLEEFASADALEPNQLFFCRLISHGQAKLKTLYDIKRRLYIGNTTMDPELAFIQQTLLTVFEGGLLLSAAEFGAYTLGTEINYQIAKAVGKSSRHGVSMRSTRESVMANFEQYGTDRCFLTPYGIREKGRKIGKKPRGDHWTLSKAECEYHFPEKQPYSLESTFIDLCDLAAKTLLIGSKLSFWFPTIIDSYSEDCLPVHPALRLVANCEQRLSRKTSRRLLVYQKYREALPDERAWCPASHFQNASFRDVTFTPRLAL
ncbi:unnamed protein product [Angiostrongylus costaricensis]|uniref:DNA-directed DNA polymerase n=1 Tax=Angiostrongylus costaricensis TaxID=334426 RepID=A0A0R3PN15_ANGCS|nr:unnamed protein product [Angiostrongylus costaricensis]